MELEILLAMYTDEEGYLAPLDDWASEHLVELELLISAELQKRGAEHDLGAYPGILRTH